MKQSNLLRPLVMGSLRKKFCLFVLATFTFIFFTGFLLSSTASNLPHEDQLEQRLAEVRVRVQYLDALYRARQEDLLALGRAAEPANATRDAPPPLSERVRELLANISGYHAATGFQAGSLTPLRMPYAHQLMPHLLNDPASLRPLYHMHGNRTSVDIVVGVPTVKRDKENYLMVTLSHLISGLNAPEDQSIVIIVFIGETDAEFILQTARQIENLFPKQVESGLIEVLAPSPGYYPDLKTVPLSLGDPQKRVMWRTKQNLDCIYLMTYAKTKGTFYLMLEDDIITKKNYITEIKNFASIQEMQAPNWIVIEYCRIGGIGKLFKSADLTHFITYIQLFYTNLPIDWLIESYLADKVCTIEKQSTNCVKEKLVVRPRYKQSLFQHIGLYSSLPGKIQKLKDTNFGSIPTFYPNSNPPVASIVTDIKEKVDHTLRHAYDGTAFFWGNQPRKGDKVEFVFKRPIKLARILFRSGNIEHIFDKFYDTALEVLPVKHVDNSTDNYVVVGHFNELGIAEGDIDKDIGEIKSLRLSVGSNSDKWVLLSEISLTEVGSR